MRKRRILSLLLAVAVMATMLVAVPLTASAAGTSEFVVQESTSGNVDDKLINDNNLVVTVKINNIALGSYAHNYGDSIDAKKSIQVRSNDAPSAEQQYGTSYNTTTSTLALNVKNPGKLTLYYRRQNDQGASDKTQFTAGDAKDVKVSQPGEATHITGVLTHETPSEGYAYGYQTFTLGKGDYVIWATGSTIQLNAIRFEPSQIFAVDPSEVAVKAGDTTDINITISGYEGKTAENVTWSIPEEYNGKINVENKPGENKATVSVLEGAEDMAGHTATITATLGDTGATAELKVEILPASSDTLVPVYESTKFTFEEFDTVSSTTETLINKKQNMKVNPGTDGVGIVEGETTLANQDKVSKHLDLKGSGGTDKRSVEITPGVDGAVTVYAAHGNASETRTLNIEQNGKTEGLSLTGKNVIGNKTVYVTAGQPVYIYSGRSGINVYAIYFEPAPKFGDKSYDSGYYYNGDDESETNKRGVIRFFQGFAGKNVEDYGFVFIDGDANSTNYYANKISGGKKDFSTESLEGFYGTVKDIVISSPETIYAKAFVTINGATFFGDTITGEVSGDSDHVNQPE